MERWQREERDRVYTPLEPIIANRMRSCVLNGLASHFRMLCLRGRHEAPQTLGKSGSAPLPLHPCACVRSFHSQLEPPHHATPRRADHAHKEMPLVYSSRARMDMPRPENGRPKRAVGGQLPTVLPSKHALPILVTLTSLRCTMQGSIRTLTIAESKVR